MLRWMDGSQDQCTVYIQAGRIMGILKSMKGAGRYYVLCRYSEISETLSKISS